MVRKVRGWYEKSMVRMVRKVHGWYEKSMGRNVHGTKSPSMGRNVYGTKSLWYEIQHKFSHIVAIMYMNEMHLCDEIFGIGVVGSSNKLFSVNLSEQISSTVSIWNVLISTIYTRSNLEHQFIFGIHYYIQMHVCSFSSFSLEGSVLELTEN